jgi:hypothetical protein
LPNDVTSPDEHTHVFILRIWRERREIEQASPKWRGVITHLTSEKKQYFEELDKISEFIIPFIEEMGLTAQPPQEPASLFRHWLASLWKRPKKAA